MSYNRFSDSDDDDDTGERSTAGYNSEREFYDEEVGHTSTIPTEKGGLTEQQSSSSSSSRSVKKNNTTKSTTRGTEGTTVIEGITSKLTSPAFFKSLFTSNNENKSNIREEKREEAEEVEEASKRTTSAAPNEDDDGDEDDDVIDYDDDEDEDASAKQRLRLEAEKEKFLIEMQNQPLKRYRTRDVTHKRLSGGETTDDEEDEKTLFVNNGYEFEEMELEKKGKEPISAKVYWIGSVAFICLLITLGAIVILVTANENSNQMMKIRDHRRIHVTVPSGKCGTTYQCPDDDPQDVLGSCIGCGLKSSGCGFNVSVSWGNVTRLPIVQKAYLFGTSDCKEYWQTGFAHPIHDSVFTGNYSSGQAMVTDGCWSLPDTPIAVVACLSILDLTESKFTHGFPLDNCNSTYGVCLNTNDVFMDLLPCCRNGLWWVNETAHSGSAYVSPSS